MNESTEIQTPADFCAGAADMQLCYVQYLAEREYARATDPAQSALTDAFPVLVVLFFAFLALKLAGL